MQVIQGDITDYDSVLEACRGADVVVHMASLVDVWHRVPPSLIHAVNVAGQTRPLVVISVFFFFLTVPTK